MLPAGVNQVLDLLFLQRHGVTSSKDLDADWHDLVVKMFFLKHTLNEVGSVAFIREG